MSSSFDLQHELLSFSGRAPIFPLSDVVLFPHILLPLHVFEPRYRTLISDALDSNGLIAMALLKPGWELHHDDTTPGLYETVCLGRIVADHRLATGEYNLALQGLSRAVLLEEEQNDLCYRVGQLDLLSDHYPRDPVIDRRHRQRELLAGFREMFPQMDLGHVFHQAFDADIPLGGLCDVLAYSMQLEPAVAQGTLEEANVDLRSDLVLEHIRSLLAPCIESDGLSATHTVFPPPFSRN